MRIISLFLFLFSVGNAYSESQSWDQHKELFQKGTITTKDGTVYDILFIPGTKNVTELSRESFEDSGETLSSFADKEFYRQTFITYPTDGLKFAFEGSFQKYWLGGIENDAVRLGDVWRETGTFGGFAGKVAGTGWFAVKVLVRTVTAPVGVALGVGYAAVAPVVSVAAVPTIAALEFTLGGIAIPAALYVWNGTSWVATYLSDVPEKEGIFVQIVTSPPSEPPVEQTVIIDMQGLESIIKGSTAKVIYQEKLNDLSVKIKEVLAQHSRLREEVEVQEGHLADNEFHSKLNEYFNSTWWHHFELDETSKRYLLNQEELRAFVVDYLKTIGEEASDATVDSIVDMIFVNISKITKAPPPVKSSMQLN